VDDALGEEVRVTVIAAGFDKAVERAERYERPHFEGRIARLLEEPSPTPVSVASFEPLREREQPTPVPSILAEDEDEIFNPAPETVSFDAEEDLDIPDFLKS
jgi:cell division protein FtsZ